MLAQTKKSIITVVDNGSPNNSYHELSLRYQNEDKVFILNNNLNVGYARGNNVGIQFLINNFEIYNIFVCNNDTIFTDKCYIEKLCAIKISREIGAVGTEIIGADGYNQNPQKLNMSLLYFLMYIIKAFLKKKLGEKVFALKILSKTSLNHIESSKVNSSKSKTLEKNIVLHGSAILLTENYLKTYKGFYPNTFLYFEENILKIIFNKFKLKMLYINSLSIYHKEDQSSKMSFDNKDEIKKGYSVQSAKAAIKVLFKTKSTLLRERSIYEQQI